MISSFRIIVLAILLIATVTYAVSGAFYGSSTPMSKKIKLSSRLNSLTAIETESTATSKVENVLSTISGIVSLESESTSAYFSILLTLKPNEDPVFKKLEVTNAVRRIIQELPANCSFPEIDIVKSETPSSYDATLRYALFGNVDQAILTETAKRLSEDLHLTERNIVSVTHGSSPRRGFQIDTRRYANSRLKISNNDILEHLVNEFKAKTAAPTDYTSSESSIIYIPGDVTIDKLNRVKLKKGNVLANLEDIATVSPFEEGSITINRYNGYPAQYIDIKIKPSFNPSSTITKIQESINKKTKNLRADINCIQIDNPLDEMMNNYVNGSYQLGIVISALIIYLFLAVRNRKYVTLYLLTFLLSLGLSIACIALIYKNLKNDTFVGLSITTGIIVTIMFIGINSARNEFAARSFNIALWSLLAILFITIHFLLRAMQNEDHSLSGLYYVTPIAIACTCLVTGFLTPSLVKILNLQLHHSKFPYELKDSISDTKKKYFSLVAKLSRSRLAAIIPAFIILALGAPVAAIPENTKTVKLINNLIRPATYENDVIPILNNVIGGASGLFTRKSVSKNSTPNEIRTSINIKAQLQQPTIDNSLDSIVRSLEKFMTLKPYVDNVQSSIIPDRSANIEVTFKKGYESTTKPISLKMQVSELTTKFGGIDWSITGYGLGFGQSAAEESHPLKLMLEGYNYDTLQKVSVRISNLLTKNRRVTKVVVDDKLDEDDEMNQTYNLTIRPGLPTLDNPVSQSVSNAFPRSTETDIYKDDSEPIIIKVSNGLKSELPNDKLMNLSLPTMGRTRLSLQKSASLQLNSRNGVIRKKNRQFSMAISFKYLGSKEFGNLFVQNFIKENTELLPLGYRLKSQIILRGRSGSLNSLYTYGILSLAIICFGCIFFNSFKKAIILFLSVPSAIVPALLLFSLTDMRTDRGTNASFVFLSCIALILSFYTTWTYTQLRKSISREKAFQETITGCNRLTIIALASCAFSYLPYYFLPGNSGFWPGFISGSLAGYTGVIVFQAIILPILLRRYEFKNKSA